MIDRRSENVTVEEGDRRTWELAGQLVQIDSSDPGAYESQIEQWIYEWLTKEIEEKAGALKNRIELIQKEVMPGRFNLMARIPGREEAAASSLVYICHMDTVMLGEGWEEDTPALGAVVKEDRLYGRGACDMKSGLACALSAFSDMAELAVCIHGNRGRGRFHAGSGMCYPGRLGRPGRLDFRHGTNGRADSGSP